MIGGLCSIIENIFLGLGKTLGQQLRGGGVGGGVGGAILVALLAYLGSKGGLSIGSIVSCHYHRKVRIGIPPCPSQN